MQEEKKVIATHRIRVAVEIVYNDDAEQFEGDTKLDVIHRAWWATHKECEDLVASDPDVQRAYILSVRYED
jgi:hypothetical protein